MKTIEFMEDNVALFLPTLNEAESIRSMIVRIRKNFKGFFFVVDGFSTDDTIKIAREEGVFVYYRLNNGKGSAIQKALEVAALHGKEFLLFIDCDMSYDPDNIKDMIQDLGNYDLVIGVRPLEKIDALGRRLGNIVATELVNIAFGGNVQDSISGLKCLRVSKFIGLIKENGWVVDSLICLYALKFDMRIRHVSINYYKRLGQSKLSMATGIAEFIKLIKAVWTLR